MPKYIVTATATVTYTQTVEASSAWDAGESVDDDLSKWEETDISDFQIKDTVRISDPPPKKRKIRLTLMVRLIPARVIRTLR